MFRFDWYIFFVVLFLGHPQNRHHLSLAYLPFTIRPISYITDQMRQHGQLQLKLKRTGGFLPFSISCATPNGLSQQPCFLCPHIGNKGLSRKVGGSDCNCWQR